MKAVYLDHNATTPIDPQALEAMLPFLRADYGNPSSAHELGRRARDAVESARAEVAALIGAAPGEIVFTSGGTESINLALRGTVDRDARRTTVVKSSIEHPATDATCALLQRQGRTIIEVEPEPDGVVDADRMIGAIDARTAVVTLIHAQNEIGTLQPVSAVGAAARSHGAIMHVDGAQSVGKIPVDVRALRADLLSIAGHKLYAPKGVGALYVRQGLSLPPLLVGAGQEQGRRPGTENVAGIVGLGAACRIAARMLDTSVAAMASLSEALLARLRHEVPGLTLVGHPRERLPNTLNLVFPGASGRALLAACPRVLASTGSACHADREEPSAVLTALGLPPGVALGALRLSLGRGTTTDDVVAAAASLGAAWRLVSKRAPLRRGVR